MRNQKFIIQPHFRLQEWVAEEKGYFADEGLDYVFEETVRSTDGKAHAQGIVTFARAGTKAATVDAHDCREGAVSRLGPRHVELFMRP